MRPKKIMPLYEANTCLKCEYCIAWRARVNLGSCTRGNGGHVYYGGGLAEYFEKQKRESRFALPTLKHF